VRVCCEPTKRCFEGRITPTFVPADSGRSDYLRKLSAMIERYGNVGTNDKYVELLPDMIFR